MPGKKGVKMIPRKARSGKFHSIKELVFSLFDKNLNVSKEEVEKVVKKEYPLSNFIHKNGSHFSWYKHKWAKMKLEDAGFIIKDPNAQKEEGAHETEINVSEEGVNDNVGRLESNGVGKKNNRAQNRRSKVRKTSRKVDVKARKRVS